MTRCKILIEGCDDETEFELDVTLDELGLLHRVAACSQDASSSGCQPKMTVEETRARD